MRRRKAGNCPEIAVGDVVGAVRDIDLRSNRQSTDLDAAQNGSNRSRREEGVDSGREERSGGGCLRGGSDEREGGIERCRTGLRGREIGEE